MTSISLDLDLQKTLVCLFGVANYDNYPDLPNVINNSSKLESTFRKGWGDFGKIYKIINPSEDDIKTALGSIVNFETILFIWSGHGKFFNDDNKSYLFLKETPSLNGKDKAEVKNKSIKTVDLISKVCNYPGNVRKIFILDACFQGTNHVPEIASNLFVLSSSSKNTISQSSDDSNHEEPLTAYISEFNAILENGISHLQKESITLLEISTEVKNRMLNKKFPAPAYPTLVAAEDFTFFPNLSFNRQSSKNNTLYDEIIEIEDMLNHPNTIYLGVKRMYEILNRNDLIDKNKKKEFNNNYRIFQTIVVDENQKISRKDMKDINPVISPMVDLLDTIKEKLGSLRS